MERVVEKPGTQQEIIRTFVALQRHLSATSCTKVLKCRIMENEALFTNTPEKNKAQVTGKTQHLPRLAMQTVSKSPIIKATTLLVPLGVYQLFSSRYGQNSRDRFERRSHSKDYPRGSTLSKDDQTHTFP
ncbi:hypothetical protein AVEN_222446-1 [Araneus ventricosus]|uniref:Uncharacterized protein n=1 Tax=Araneus ventricosus TaxID=182803 RepID=A0A4Y2U3M7_ARAVE|nr:hypothetical protein AVEN_260590-1 [Araneus ventricosus]GBO06197.1 hypothetical protein AVEN_80037-1 [Araneus ventricosus]GBO39022.1 hypothetical protein AVEN_106651-1 [Araneus ventricosus]GBO39023.1 hypothetical protein AVEN_222446-1 [Araneus ventricosus]